MILYWLVANHLILSFCRVPSFCTPRMADSPWTRGKEIEKSPPSPRSRPKEEPEITLWKTIT